MVESSVSRSKGEQAVMKLDSLRNKLANQVEDELAPHLAIAECAAMLGSLNVPITRAAFAAASLHLIGSKLHKLFEDNCNGWSTDEEVQEAIKLGEEEIRSLRLPWSVTVEVQTDPRGWPLIITSGLRTLRLGGPSQ